MTALLEKRNIIAIRTFQIRVVRYGERARAPGLERSLTPDKRCRKSRRGDIVRSAMSRPAVGSHSRASESLSKQPNLGEGLRFWSSVGGWTGRPKDAMETSREKLSLAQHYRLPG
ncbi:hypothetical protein RRF57_011764 [Xylaria bambusicola]|uniref:Uncharacterized protein n=1 Tax=Xylaria bambusicola TaxID=326684 RepID=A0AAN7ZE95_9PEZI